jgi:hypothetical protein
MAGGLGVFRNEIPNVRTRQYLLELLSAAPATTKKAVGLIRVIERPASAAQSRFPLRRSTAMIVGIDRFAQPLQSELDIVRLQMAKGSPTRESNLEGAPGRPNCQGGGLIGIRL